MWYHRPMSTQRTTARKRRPLIGLLPLLMMSVGATACAYSPPLDAEPHATMRLLLTGASGNYLRGEVSIDSKDLDEKLLAQGTVNVAPGAHTLRVKLITAQRTLGKVHQTFGLTQQLRRDVKMRNVRKCTGGIKFRVQAGYQYELHLASTGSGTTCLVECSRMVTDAEGATKRTACAMTRAY